jgi:hypothetical protein
MKSAVGFALAAAAGCSALAVACLGNLGFDFGERPPYGPPVQPPNICDAGEGGPCCGHITCDGACCLAGESFECLSDAASCNGVFFYWTECLSNRDCKGVGACCLSWFGEPGQPGSSPAATKCERTAGFGCDLLETAVCTDNDAACFEKTASP